MHYFVNLLYLKTDRYHIPTNLPAIADLLGYARSVRDRRGRRVRNMARPLRIQYLGAWYQVINRGRRGGEIFKEKKDCLAFIELIKMFSENRAESRKRYTIFILLETPEEINQVLKLKEIGTEFGISSFSTVSTIIERTRNELPNNRRLRKRIEQLRSKLVLSQEQTP